jgi:phosphate-selective porin OprO/OprP
MASRLVLVLSLFGGTAVAQTAPAQTAPAPGAGSAPAAPPSPPASSPAPTSSAAPSAPAPAPTPAPATPPTGEPTAAAAPPAGTGPVTEPAASGVAVPLAVAKQDDAGTQKQAKPVDVKVGGYLQADTREFASDSGTHEQTLRRLRFKVDGKALRYFKFRTLIETAQSRLQVLDAWIELGRPGLALRVGKDKGQFGLERLQSAAELTFIERAYPTQLAPNRDIGVALRGDVVGGLVHYSAALVNGVADNAVLEGETDDEYEYNVRVLVKPFAHRKELGDLAIGGATTFGHTNGTLANPGVTAIKSPGQATIFKYAGGGAMDTIDTTAVADGYRKRYTAHAYYYGGPIGALAEYVREDVAVRVRGTHTDLANQAWQLAVSGALTPGDRPTYKSIVPKHPFDLDARTWGAVELAARYSELRLDEDAFDAAIANPATSVQRARAGTLGVNWYLNQYIKLQLDYETTRFTGGAPDGGNRPREHLIATRFQAAI